MLKTKLNICIAITLVLLLALKAGVSYYDFDNSFRAFSFQNNTHPFFPSADEDTVTVFSILPNISLPVSERSIQHNQVECYNRYNTTGIHFASVQLHQKTREYIRYSSGIKPSLESARLIYPFHSYF